jgi:hypothetical protein
MIAVPGRVATLKRKKRRIEALTELAESVVNYEAEEAKAA